MYYKAIICKLGGEKYMVIVDFIYYKFGVLQYSIAKDLFFLDLKGLGG